MEGDLKVAQWEQKKAAEVERYDWKHFSDDSLVRQFRFAGDIGTSAMKNQTKLKQVSFACRYVLGACSLVLGWNGQFGADIMFWAHVICQFWAEVGRFGADIIGQFVVDISQFGAEMGWYYR